MSASPKTCPFLDLSSMDTTSPQCLDRGGGTSIYIEEEEEELGATIFRVLVSILWMARPLDLKIQGIR